MSAAAGLFLMLLPLAGLPVLFHLLMRRKRKKLVFSTLMFFHRVDPRLSARRKLREILLLACRVLLIALVLLALARLTIHSTGGLLGLYGKQAVVVVIDNSASMSGPTGSPHPQPLSPEGRGEKSKLRLAVDSARALLSHLDPAAEAAIVLLVPDPHAGFDNAGMTSDVEALSQALDRITPSEGTGNPVRALAQAQALLRSASSSGGAIHIFTDLQDSEWAQQKVDPRSAGSETQVMFHRIPTPRAEGSNVAIVQAEMIGQRILPRQPYHIQVALRNDDNAAVKVRLNSEDDQRKSNTEVVEIPAMKEKLVRVLVQPEAPGYHWVKLWLEGDRFAGDNKATVGYQCEDKALVLLAGVADDYGVLPFALSPFGDGRFTSLVLNYCKTDELADRVAKLRPALVVLPWESLAAGEKVLEPFVKEGGNLAILPAATGLPTAVTGPAWLGANANAMKMVDSNSALEVIDKAAPFWSGLQSVDGRLQFGRASARQFCPLTLTKDKAFVPLLGVGNDVVLASTKIGKGQVVVSGIAFDPQWTSLPRMKAMVVIAQTMALGGRLQETHGIAAVAGNPIELPGKGEQVQMVSLVGDPLDWSGSRAQLPILPRSGAASLKLGDESYCLSIRSSDREGSSKFLEGTTVPALGTMPHSVRELKEDDLKEALTASRTGFPLFLPLLLLAIGALVAESLLGAPPLRKKEAGETGTSNKASGGV